MNLKQILSESAALASPSGHEGTVAAYFAQLFRPFVDEVSVDAMYNVIAHRKGSGPKVMLCAHLDEVALMVTAIDEDGAVRVSSVGGIDYRILPGARVWVHGRERLFGTVGMLPDHLRGSEKRDKARSDSELFVDLGLPAEMVSALVNIGDIVTFESAPVELMNDRFACKTMDDRACVVMMLRAAERLTRMQCDADVWFVASSQQEVGGRGAQTSAFRINPDIAIALDVDFAPSPGVDDSNIPPLSGLGASVGPYIQPKLAKRLIDCAQQNHVDLTVTVSERSTGTDADEIGMSRAGVHSLLVSLPERYMHTTVQTIDLNSVQEGSRLLSCFLSELDESWEVDLWI